MTQSFSGSNIVGISYFCGSVILEDSPSGFFFDPEKAPMNGNGFQGLDQNVNISDLNNQIHATCVTGSWVEHFFSQVGDVLKPLWYQFMGLDKIKNLFSKKRHNWCGFDILQFFFKSLLLYNDIFYLYFRFRSKCWYSELQEEAISCKLSKLRIFIFLMFSNASVSNHIIRARDCLQSAKSSTS